MLAKDIDLRNKTVPITGAAGFNIPSTGLRFFTVYDPAGRPDMAYFGFTNKLLSGEEIQIFNYGNCRRDFTYVDDMVQGISLVMEHVPERETGENGLRSFARWYKEFYAC